jgi:N-methylhydantoinase B
MEFRKDSGGPGKFRGGLGIRRDIRIVADGELLSVIKKSKTKPWGLAGGWEPDPNYMLMFIGTNKERKVGTFRAPVKVDDHCALVSAGGGGYGDPSNRDPNLVLKDVLNEYVSPEAAQNIYKVSIKDGAVDMNETIELRSRR